MHDNEWSNSIEVLKFHLSDKSFRQYNLSAIFVQSIDLKIFTQFQEDFIVKNMLISSEFSTAFHDVKFFITDKNKKKCLSNQTMIAIIPLPVLYRPHYRLFCSYVWLRIIRYLGLRTSTMQTVNAYHEAGALRRYHWTLKYAHYIIKLVSKHLLMLTIWNFRLIR